jgi:hypothetical protein
MDGKAVAGVAGLPQASNINGCDTETAPNNPASTAGNPAECRTFEARDTLTVADVQRGKSWLDRSEIDNRLHVALIDAGRSALGMPSSVDTVKAMLARAGLALVLA